MAGGIEWFRWHHGSVTDPKFQLVAKRAGARVADVLAVWAYVLERASASATRGEFGEIDCEAVDCLFGFEDGATASILDTMQTRGLIESGRVCAWEKRQPKREREDVGAADRQRQKRQRDAADANVTPRHATSHQKKPREEESREEINTPLTPQRGESVPAGFAAFWLAWPAGDRKQAKGKCLESWLKAGAEKDASVVLAHVERMKRSALWTKENGNFVPAPLVYLNQRRWEGAESDVLPAVGNFV